jgi:predicted phage-related endonuclease
MVKNYPVAAGNCVTFKIEGKPVVMEKSVGFSQFDAPTIKRYRLVKEDIAEPQEMHQNGDNEIEAVKSTINGLKGEIDALWREIDGIKIVPKKTPAKKKEVNDDDAE